MGVTSYERPELMEPSERMTATSTPDEAKWREYCADVRLAAAGSWWKIVPALAPTLRQAVSLHGQSCPCPVHGGKDGLRVFEKDFGARGGLICNTCGPQKDGFESIGWANGWNLGRVIREVGKELGMERDAQGNYNKPDPSRLITPEPFKQNPEELRKNVERLIKAVADARPVDWTGDSPVTRYFRARGLAGILEDPPQDILEHPGMEYWATRVMTKNGAPVLRAGTGEPRTESFLIGVFPTMLAVVRNPEGKVVTYHRTYLDPRGTKLDIVKKNADGSPVLDNKGRPEKYDAKKVMSPPSKGMLDGCAIWLYDPKGASDTKIGVAEGIETVLATRLLYRMKHKKDLAVWSTMNAGQMGGLVLQPWVKHLLIFADRDDPARNNRRNAAGRGIGEQYADELIERFTAEAEDHVATKFMPRHVDTDWLDQYVELMKSKERTAAQLSGSVVGSTSSVDRAAPKSENPQDRPPAWLGKLAPDPKEAILGTGRVRIEPEQKKAGKPHLKYLGPAVGREPDMSNG